MVAVVEYGQTACAAPVRAALERRGLVAATGVTVLMGRDVDVCRRALVGRSPRADDRVLVVLDAEAPPPDAIWDVMDDGADDVVVWEGSGETGPVVDRVARWVTVERLVDSPAVRGQLVGRGPAMRGALRQLVELSVFGRGPILLLGETGTGKELAARVVHALDGGEPPRHNATGELVVVDCTTIVPTLSGSELFGHERGAFTGADRTRVGAVAQANGGTLFLDEVGDLPITLQGELLRVVQEGLYKRVGGNTWSRTSFRLVSATHRDLVRAQRKGRFRTDLYHRISSGIVQMPALRDRPEDVEELFALFLGEALGGPAPAVSPVVRDLLRERAYPGNVRELRQLAIRVAARHVGDGPVTVGDVPPADRPGRDAKPPRARPGDPGAIADFILTHLRQGAGLRELKAMVGDLAVDMALAEAHGNLRAAAEQLGVTVRALQLRRRGAASEGS